MNWLQEHHPSLLKVQKIRNLKYHGQLFQFIKYILQVATVSKKRTDP